MKSKLFKRKTVNGERRTALSRVAHVSAFLPLFWRGAGGGVFRRFLATLGMTALFCWSATAQNSNGVTVSNLVVEPGTVTFNVSWKKADMPTTWSDTVWVFVDYNDAGVMKRLPLLPGATLTETSAPDFGRVMEIDGNPNGVWIIGNARSAISGSFSATVQLLAAAAAAAAALSGTCVYAIDYPPFGKYTAVNEIKFTGTPPFYLTFQDGSDATVTQDIAKNPYTIPVGETLASFTDASGAPGTFSCKIPVAQTLIASAAGYCEGSGVMLALEDTEIDVTYQLYKNNDPVSSATLTGNGAAATFTISGSMLFGAGTYAVKTAPGAFCPAMMDGSRIITEYTPPSITEQPQPYMSCEPVATPTLTVTANPGSSSSLSYQWKTGSGAGEDVGASQTIMPTVTSTAGYWVVVTDSNGCMATSDAVLVSINGGGTPGRLGSGSCVYSGGIIGYIGE